MDVGDGGGGGNPGCGQRDQEPRRGSALSQELTRGRSPYTVAGMASWGPDQVCVSFTTPPPVITAGA